MGCIVVVYCNHGGAGCFMKQKQMEIYAKKWVIDSFYNSIAKGGYSPSRQIEGNFYKKQHHIDLLATMCNNKKSALYLDESGFTVDEQIEAGLKNKEVLATIYDNLTNAKKLEAFGISYDMQVQLGERYGNSFQTVYDKTDEIEDFIVQNDIQPILLTSYLMQKSEPAYLLAEGDSEKASAEIKKIQECNDFLQKILPKEVATLFCKANLPEDVGGVIAEHLVRQSSGVKDFKALVRLSEAGKKGEASQGR